MPTVTTVEIEDRVLEIAKSISRGELVSEIEAFDLRRVAKCIGELKEKVRILEGRE